MENNCLFPMVHPWKDSKNIIRASAAIRLKSLQSIKLIQQEPSEKTNEENYRVKRFTPYYLHTQILRALANWPNYLDISLNLRTFPLPSFPLGGKIKMAIVITAQTEDTNETNLMAEVLSRVKNLFGLLTSYLPEVEFEYVTQHEELKAWLHPFHPSEVYRIDRQRERFQLVKPMIISKGPVGFLSASRQDDSAAPKMKNQDGLEIDYLFPWSQDSRVDLAKICDALLGHPSFLWYQVRLRPCQASEQEKKTLRVNLTHCEALLAVRYPSESLLSIQTDALRQALSQRLSQLNRPLFSGGVFLCSLTPLDEALVAALANEISSPPAVSSDKSYLPLKGGVAITSLAPKLFVESDCHSPDVYTVEEAACAFRIPSGLHQDPPGLPIKHYRTELIAPHLVLGGQGEMLLEVNRHRGLSSEVRLTSDDRMRHLAIMGQTGTGKSVFLESLVLQDIIQGRGCCFIDPHGDSVEKLLRFYPKERANDLILVDFQERERILPFNLLQYQNGEERDRIIDDFYAWMDMMYDMNKTGGPMFEMYYRSFMRLLLPEIPRQDFTPVMADFVRMFADRKFLDYCLDQCTSGSLIREVKNSKLASGDVSLTNMAPYIVSKFNRCFSGETMQLMMGQEEMILDFHSIMDQGKVVLVNLGRGRFGQTTTSFLASQIVSRLHSAAMQRINIPVHERRDFFLYVDEFQNVASESFISLLSEARKFRLGLILANQYADQLGNHQQNSNDSVLNAILGNVGTTLCFRLGVRDASAMEEVYQPVFMKQDLCNLPVGRCYVNLKARSKNPCSFSMETQPLKEEQTIEENAAMLRELSRITFMKDKECARKDMDKRNQLIDQIILKK